MQGLSDLPVGDQVFRLLALTILGIFGIGLAFILLTVLLRRKNARDTEDSDRREKKWEPVLLEVLAGSYGPKALLDLVLPEEPVPFLNYLALFIRRIRGSEAETLRAMARPLLPALVERHEKRAFQRAQIIRTVGILGMPGYEAFLEEALDDPSPQVALMAAEALLRPGYPEFVDPVLARFHRFERWHTAPLSRLLSNVGPEASPELRSALANPDYPTWVRIVLAQALRTLRDVESADLAAQIIETGPDRELLVGCLKLLAEVGEARHRRPLLPFLESTDFPVRAQALRALRVAGDGEDLPLFTKALDDPSPWVALEAARGMAALGGKHDLRKLAASQNPLSTLASQVLEE